MRSLVCERIPPQRNGMYKKARAPVSLSAELLAFGPTCVQCRTWREERIALSLSKIALNEPFPHTNKEMA